MPSTALADPPLESGTANTKKPTVRRVGKADNNASKNKQSPRGVRLKPISKQKPNRPVHPLAEKLRSQVEKSIEQSSMVSVHAKRLEEGIRRAAKARLLADTLRTKLSQNKKLEKPERGQLERNLARAEQQSQPMQGRRKNQRKVQLAQLSSIGFSPDRKIPDSLLKRISLHYQRRAEIERILFVAAKLGDFETTAKAEKLLEVENSRHENMLSQSAAAEL